MAPTTVTMAATTNAHSGFDLATAIYFTGGPTTTGIHELSIGAPTTSTSNSVSTSTNTIIAGTSTYNSATAIPAPHWAAGRTSFRNLSVWAYLALGVIMVALVMVLGYTFYSCCRTATRVETGDDETDGKAENGDGDGGEDGDEKEKEKVVCCHADWNQCGVDNLGRPCKTAAGIGPRADGTERTSSLVSDLAVSA
jgi:hypothetical protein